MKNMVNSGESTTERWKWSVSLLVSGRQTVAMENNRHQKVIFPLKRIKPPFTDDFHGFSIANC